MLYPPPPAFPLDLIAIVSSALSVFSFLLTPDKAREAETMLIDIENFEPIRESQNMGIFC